MARSTVAKKLASVYVQKQVTQTKSEIIEGELDKIHKEEGQLTPKLIVDRARDPHHPLHPYFEWDNSVAAEKWREEQAYKMILTTKFVLLINQNPHQPPKVDKGIAVRKFLPTLEAHTFDIRDQVLNEAETRANVIRIKIAKLRGWCKEVSDLEELADLKNAIEKLLPAV